MTIETLLETIKESGNSQIDVSVVKKAYELAERAHRGQKRKSGEPYIQHPLHVANTLATVRLDTATIAAALLHDTLEDTPVTKEDIREAFGPNILRLVEGATKLNNLKVTEGTGREIASENLRKMFLAMAADIRVVLIKLSDRYHNMRTLDALSDEQRQRIAKETLNVYAPLANRLGIGELRTRLEDLAFPIILPKEAEWTRKLFEEEIESKRFLLKNIEQEVRKLLEDNGYKTLEIHGRIKGLYSLYRKLLRYDKNISKIYDLAALRVVVETIPACYAALGIIHKAYKPLVGRIKDYISIPKANGYRSLHTTVITPKGGILEIQIRTKEMHEAAEYGVVAHWHYIETGKPSEGAPAVEDHLAWVQQLAEWQKEIESGEEFEENLRIDLFHDRIFVFTPSSEVLDLPEGATPIDFAYAIHTRLGHQAESAIVNDHDHPLEAALANGDVVRIVTNPNSIEYPKRSWLPLVKTAAAKRAIRQWYSQRDREENVKEGHRLLDEHVGRLKGVAFDRIQSAKRHLLLSALNKKSEEELFLAVGRGDLSPESITRRLFAMDDFFRPRAGTPGVIGQVFGYKPQPRAWITDLCGIISNFAKDCRAEVGSPIKAIIRRGEHQSTMVHAASCPVLKAAQEDPDVEIVEAEWDTTIDTVGEVSLEVTAVDRFGLVNDLTKLILESDHQLSYIHADTRKAKNGTVTVYLMVELESLEELDTVLSGIGNLQGILSVQRIGKIPQL